jgi:hypothetical protein
MPLLIQRAFDGLIEEFIAEDVFVNLSQLGGGVIHGRPMAINSPSSLRTRSTAGAHTPGTEPRRGSARSQLCGQERGLRIAATLFESPPTPSVLVKQLATSTLAHYFYQPTGSESEEYHKWYYNTGVWKKTTWMGFKCWKSASDMWNYQEILV